jgi:hypothetical protein
MAIKLHNQHFIHNPNLDNNDNNDNNEVLNDEPIFNAATLKIEETSKVRPSEHLMNFVKHTQTNPEYAFTVPGSLYTTKKYIHNMRVELSRWRSRIINQGKKPIFFKIFCLSINQNEDGTCTAILARKRKHDNLDHLVDLMDSQFSSITDEEFSPDNTDFYI